MIENGILKPSGVIQLRGGIRDVLQQVNPLLARREIMVEIDTGKIKVGDGTHNWNDLPYTGGGTGLDFPASDDNLYAVKNGEWVIVSSSGATLPVEASWNVTITKTHVSQKYITLPTNADTSCRINVFINGILTEQNIDWILDNNKISWSGLTLDGLIQAGDKIIINYFRR